MKKFNPYREPMKPNEPPTMLVSRKNLLEKSFSDWSVTEIGQLNFPNEATYFEVHIGGEDEIIIRFFKYEETKNPKFDSEIKKYEKDLDEYKKELADWNEKKKEWDISQEEETIENLKSEYIKTKKKTRKDWSLTRMKYGL